MAKKSAGVAKPPGTENLNRLKAASKGCTACPLHLTGTQTVFGEGKKGARLLLVGEQPGDREDLAGRPFVGPSGRLLDELFEKAGIPRDEVYVTNAVKHFKWRAQGKRRLHEKPNAAERNACRPWLEAEVRALKPAVMICLGATAVASVLGPGLTLKAGRGKVFRNAMGVPATIVSWHPSAVLRAPDPQTRHELMEGLLKDLKKAWRLIGPRDR